MVSRIIEYRVTQDAFVWIRCLEITFCSVYLTPNEIMSDFQRRFYAPEDAGVDGGVSSRSGRLKQTLEMAARTPIVVLNILVPLQHFGNQVAKEASST